MVLLIRYQFKQALCLLRLYRSGLYLVACIRMRLKDFSPLCILDVIPCLFDGVVQEINQINGRGAQAWLV